MTLSLNIGSPAPTLVQAGVVWSNGDSSGSPPAFSTTGPFLMTLPAPSTAGTTLVALISCSTTGGNLRVASLPAGWSLLKSGVETTNSDIELWAYLNNPGGMSSVNVSFSNATYGDRFLQMTEWSNVVSVGTLEASGSANATSGTTLALTTSGNVLTANDVAIAAWIQGYSVLQAATFTSPGGWTRLGDNGTTVLSDHYDAEYLLNPSTGATLSATLTSNRTQITAAGIIVVLKAAPAIADQAAYILYDSMTLKLNTLDFVLIDCPTPVQIGAAVTLSSPGDFPDWVGTVTQVRAADLVDIASGHALQTVTCTNTQLPNFTDAPYKLTDAPATNTTDFLLTQGGDFIQLQNGSGNLLLQSSVQEQGYAGLSIGQQVGSVGPPMTLTTIGELTSYVQSLWPGMTFTLVSSNLANWITAPNAQYTIQTISITWHGANPPLPIYQIQFGDRIQTLAEWTAQQV